MLKESLRAKSRSKVRKKNSSLLKLKRKSRRSMAMSEQSSVSGGCSIGERQSSSQQRRILDPSLPQLPSIPDTDNLQDSQQSNEGPQSDRTPKNRHIQNNRFTMWNPCQNNQAPKRGCSLQLIPLGTIEEQNMSSQSLQNDEHMNRCSEERQMGKQSPQSSSSSIVNEDQVEVNDLEN